MDHKHIDEADLVERYLMGRLAGEETAEFEAHFINCPECVGQLNTTKALIDGLRTVASDQARGARGFEPGGLLEWLQPTRSRWPLVLAATVLLLAVGAVVVTNQIRRSRFEADQARSASAEWERRYQEEREASSLAELKNQDSERDLKAQLAQLRNQLENGHKQNPEEAAEDQAALKKPQINMAIFVLKATRGSEPAAGALNELVVPRSPADFVISVQLEGERSHKTYRTTIRNDRKRLIWKESGLKPDSYNALTALFNSTFFDDGDYLLTVEGIAGDGNASVVGQYSFRVRKTP